MARTAVTKTNAPGNYATAGASLVMTAADTTNFNSCPSTGKELIVAQNTGASPYTVTITSKADPYGRTGDIATETIAASEIRIYGPFPNTGWQQTDGNLYFQASNVAVKFGVIVLP